MSDTTPTESAPRRVAMPSLAKSSFKLLTYGNNQWRCVAAIGTPYERCLQDDYWSTVSTELQPYDEINLIAADGSYFAKLLCIAASRGHARVMELGHWPLPVLLVAGDSLPVNHEVFWGGPEEGFCVRRISDSVMLGKNFANRNEAIEFLLSHATLR